MNKKKALLALVCAVALVTTTFFATMAYFTDTDKVTNTFTVGKVDIKLDEAKVTTDGKPVSSEERVQENTYHLIPGQTYTKDPTVTVIEDSEDSYVYMLVKVENFDNITENVFPKQDFPQYYGSDGTFLIQNLCNWQANSDWTYAGFMLDPQANPNVGIYRFVYKNGTAVNAKGESSPADNKLQPLFTTITLPGADVTSETAPYLEGTIIKIEAYAVQAAGFATFDAAWSATYGANKVQFGNNANFAIPATSVNP